MDALSPALSSCQYVASQILETSASSPLEYLSILPILLFVKVALSHIVQRLKLKEIARTSNTIPQKLNKLLKKHSISANAILTTNQSGTIAYVAGLLQQNIVFSNQIIQDLPSKQLEAVLLHESFHMKNRHPLLFLLATSVSSIFWFLPTLGELSEILQTKCEVAADQFAVTIQGTNAHLVQALHACIAVDRSPQHSRFAVNATVGFYSKILEQRIAVLLSSSRTATPQVSLRGLGISLFALVGICTLVLLKPSTTVSAHAPDHCTFAQCVAQCVSEQLKSSAQFSPGLYSPASAE